MRGGDSKFARRVWGFMSYQTPCKYLHRHFSRALTLGTLTVCGLATTQTARADRRDFPFTYEWRQAQKGEREFEVKNTYSALDNQFVQQFELEYGVTDRLTVAPYLVFERERGESYRYHEFKLETRYQLGKYKRDRFLPGLYLEYARERGGESELEGKIILSRYGSDGSNLSFNLISERAVESGAEFDNAYSIGYARDLNQKGLRGGGELIHNLSRGTTNAGPVASVNLSDDVWVTAGYAFALNKRDINGPQVRVNFEYEF